jgi:predicted NUDIX family phosphoesterase
MPTDNVTRKKQRVLVVPESALDRLYDSARFYDDDDVKAQVLECIVRSGIFIDRETAELGLNGKQIVAYGLVRHGDKVLCIRRAKKSARGELRLKFTLLFGGHVESIDNDPQVAVEECLRRELLEELGIGPVRSLEYLGVAVDPTTPSGKLHLGLVFDVAFHREIITVSATRDRAEFVSASGRKSYRLEPIRICSKKRLDPWSQLFLASKTADRIFGFRREFGHQLDMAWPDGRVAETG